MADTVESVGGGHRFRIRCGKGQRRRFLIPLPDPGEAEKRGATCAAEQ